jgi:anti-anti-sigma regulatory factor
MIEVHEEGAHSGHAAVLIRCAESGGAVGVVRGVDLALQLGQTTVVVDLGERHAADADLLSALYRSGQRVRDAGGRFTLVCADSRLRRLFDVTLLSCSLPVYETQEEALAG